MLYSHRTAWANWHILGQLDTFLAQVQESVSAYARRLYEQCKVDISSHYLESTAGVRTMLGDDLENGGIRRGWQSHFAPFPDSFLYRAFVNRAFVSGRTL